MSVVNCSLPPSISSLLIGNNHPMGVVGDLPVVMCIGSDKVSGDMLGPEVGRILSSEYNLKAYVYGVTGRNIHGANIDIYDDFIRQLHGGSKVIAVDACLGAIDQVGSIKVKNKGIGAGFAVRKDASKFYGDMGIVGIVSETSEDNVMSLISADFEKVLELSKRIAEYIAENLQMLGEK